MISQAYKTLYMGMWARDFDLFYDDILQAKERGAEVVAVLYGRAERNRQGILSPDGEHGVRGQ